MIVLADTAYLILFLVSLGVLALFSYLVLILYMHRDLHWRPGDDVPAAPPDSPLGAWQEEARAANATQYAATRR